MHNKHLLITGGTGFLGTHICERALQLDYRISLLTRDAERAVEQLPNAVHCYENLDDIADLTPVSCVINLAGEPLVKKRWNKARKKEFLYSRIGTTQALFDHFQQLGVAPPTIISGSAVGYYGHQGDRVLDESGVFKDSFSHQLCAAWEKSATKLSKLGSRVCLIRTGIVLDKNQGALAQMLPPFRWGVGGPIGTGKQWMPWIHIDDFVALIFHCIHRSDLRGAINATAPGVVKNSEFSKTLGKVLRRPAFFRVTKPLAKLMFGEMAKELLLTGQRIYPRKALETGFKYSYPDLEPALRNLLLDEAVAD